MICNSLASLQKNCMGITPKNRSAPNTGSVPAFRSLKQFLIWYNPILDISIFPLIVNPKTLANARSPVIVSHKALANLTCLVGLSCMLQVVMNYRSFWGETYHSSFSLVGLIDMTFSWDHSTDSSTENWTTWHAASSDWLIDWQFYFSSVTHLVQLLFSVGEPYTHHSCIIHTYRVVVFTYVHIQLKTYKIYKIH